MLGALFSLLLITSQLNVLVGPLNYLVKDKIHFMLFQYCLQGTEKKPDISFWANVIPMLPRQWISPLNALRDFIAKRRAHVD